MKGSTKQGVGGDESGPFLTFKSINMITVTTPEEKKWMVRIAIAKYDNSTLINDRYRIIYKIDDDTFISFNPTAGDSYPLDKKNMETNYELLPLGTELTITA